MRKFVFPAFAGILLTLSAAAQDSTAVTTLREVVVSATRMEQPVIEIPRSVTVISQEVIENSVYQSLADLLNAESGLYVLGANQTPGTNQSIFMRGANSNQVAVLIDGVRITDPSSPNAAIDLSEISLLSVERIEIIRGSHSTMFGGAAVGGVINIITKKNSTPGFHGNVAWQGGVVGAGSYSSVENLDLNYTFESGWYVNGALYQQNVEGWDASEEKASATSFTSDEDDFRKTDAFVKTGFRDESWDGFFLYKKSGQLAEIDKGAFSDDDNNYLTFDRSLLEYNVAYKPGAFWRLTMLGSVTGSERFNENDSSKISATAYDKSYFKGAYHGELQTHEIQLNFKNQGIKGLIGAGLFKEKMFFDTYFFYNDPDYPFEATTNYDSIDTSTRSRYVFGQAGYGVGNFNISGGARLSHHSQFGRFLTFEINPSFSWNNLLAYGSLSTGYNAPSLYQLFDPSTGYMAFTSRGNEDLQAEESLSLEVGVKKNFTSGTYVTFSAFQTGTTNSIEYVYLWNSSKSISDLDYSDFLGDTYINVAGQQVRGLELETFLQIADWVSFNGTFTALKGETRVEQENLREEETGGNHVQLYSLGAFLNQDLNQKHLPRRPDFTSFAELKFVPRTDLSLAIGYRYTGRRFDLSYDPALGPFGALSRIQVDAYHLVDFGVNWKATKALSVAAKVENIFNSDYREVVGFQTRGRSAYLKLMAKW
jgi:vitamin B12 transporter